MSIIGPVTAKLHERTICRKPKFLDSCDMLILRDYYAFLCFLCRHGGKAGWKSPNSLTFNTGTLNKLPELLEVAALHSFAVTGPCERSSSIPLTCPSLIFYLTSQRLVGV